MNEYDPIDKALDVKADIVREKRKISKKIKEQDLGEHTIMLMEKEIFTLHMA